MKSVLQSSVLLAAGALFALSGCVATQPRQPAVIPAAAQKLVQQPPIYLELDRKWSRGADGRKSFVKIEVTSWRRISNGRWGAKGLPVTPDGVLFLVAPESAALDEYRLVPLDQVRVSTTFDASGKRKIEVEGPHGRFETTQWLRFAVCSPLSSEPKASDCVLSEQGKIYSYDLREYDPVEFGSDRNTHPLAPLFPPTREAAAELTLRSMDAEQGRSAYEAAFQKYQASKREYQQRQAADSEARRRKQEERVTEIIRRSPRGTTMFCETRSFHLVPGESISTLAFDCDLLGDRSVKVRELLSNGWIIASETRTPVQGMTRAVIYQVSLQVRKQ